MMNYICPTKYTAELKVLSVVSMNALDFDSPCLMAVFVLSILESFFLVAMYSLLPRSLLIFSQKDSALRIWCGRARRIDEFILTKMEVLSVTSASIAN